jgi:hypothetical protein
MATPETFGNECRRLRDSLEEGDRISELDYRILRSNIVLLLADLERFGRPDRHASDATAFFSQSLRTSPGPEAA